MKPALAFLALLILALPAAALEHATFAGGCFWCMEGPFEKLPGVISVASGYTGGAAPQPTYEQVSGGGTGHKESVDIVFDPKKISYEQLLDVFWHNIDPEDDTGQFCDKGEQYQSAIFYRNDNQRRLAEASKRAIEETKKIKVVTQIRRAAYFNRAEDYHQDYYRKNPVRYKFYRFNCGRDARLQDLWGDAAGH